MDFAIAGSAVMAVTGGSEVLLLPDRRPRKLKTFLMPRQIFGNSQMLSKMNNTSNMINRVG